MSSRICAGVICGLFVVSNAIAGKGPEKEQIKLGFIKMLLEHPRYYANREELLSFLQEYEHGGGARAA